MATDLDTLRVRIDADIGDLKSAMREAGVVVRQETAKMDQRFTLGFNRMAGRAKFWAAAVATATAAFTVNSIKLAADAEETQQLFNEVFKQSSADVEDWAASFAAATGRSVIDLKTFASNFQDTFVPMGFAREEAAKLSITLSQLAIDLGSFKNVRADEAASLLQSALVGNHRAVRRFGIVISEARLQNELFRMGVKQNALDVDTLTKVQARLNIIFADSKDAQGDLVRTADSTQNRMRAVESAAKDLSITFGQVFTKSVAESSGAIIGLLNSLERLAQFHLPTELLPTDVLEERIEALQFRVKQLSEGNVLFDFLRSLGFKSDDEQRLTELAVATGELALARMRLANANRRANQDPGVLDIGIDTLPTRTPQIDKGIEKAKLLTLETIKMSRALAAGRITTEEAEASLRAYASALSTAKGEQVEQNQALFEAKTKTEQAKNAFKAIADALADTETEAERYQKQIAKLMAIQKDLPEQSELIAKAIARLNIAMVDATPMLRERNRLLQLQADLNGAVASSAEGLAELEARARAREIGIEDKQLSGKALEEFVKEMTPVLVAQDRATRKQEILRRAVEDSIKPQQRYNEQLELLNELYEDGDSTAEQYEAALKSIREEYIEQDTVLRALRNSSDDLWDSIVDGAVRGQLSMQDFGRIARQVIQDFTRDLLRAENIRAGGSSGNVFLDIGKALLGLVPGAGAGTQTGVGFSEPTFGFGKGGAILPRAAQGMVVKRPTDIRVAETAGAEGIFPLAKTAGGELGVKAIGGGDGGVAIYNIDARGAALGVEDRIVRAIQHLDASIERRAVRAVRGVNARMARAA